MTNGAFISICIPAYKHVEYLKRLLDSVAIQTFKNYEIVITDDSPGIEVEKLALGYKNLPIRYIKNKTPLGSPENWNSSIRNATGEWIKIMHDDDWFSSSQSLEEFADVAKSGIGDYFIFSGFVEVDVEKQVKKEHITNSLFLGLLKKSPLTLFKKNFIGHPSTTLFRNKTEYIFDNQFKWVVDIEFYIRYLNRYKNFIAIKKPLINIGISEDQITKEVFRNPKVEIPEALELLGKLPSHSLKNIFCYDYYWRFIRNMEIRKEDDIREFAPTSLIPFPVRNMLETQKRFPLLLLKNGFASKLLMLISYTRNYKYL